MFIRSLLLLSVGVFGAGALADDGAVEPAAIDLSQIMLKMSGGGSDGGDQEDKEYPEFEKVTKDMVSQEGLFTLWYFEGGGKDKDTEKLLCQIPSGFLGQKFMLSTSFSGGGFFTGFPLDERVVQWEVLGRQLVLIEPETRFVVNGSGTVNDVVRRTYPDRIRTAVPIMTKSPGGDPVIDLGALLKSNFADIGWMSFGRGGGINSSLSKWIRKTMQNGGVVPGKAFPDNVEIGVELAVGSWSPSGSYNKKLIHFSFWRLKDSPYAPRMADDRVGYFLTTNRDWSKPTESRDIFNRYIDRWHLVKRDAELELCEPKQPIIFYIEKTVPVRFRRAVRDGILEWNKAYEKIGFLNAVEVRQQTDDNEWKNLDPEDMRYSFFRWIVAGAGFAMGPHRSNPFTGQIYDADIIFDDAMVRYFEQEAAHMLPSTAIARKLHDPVLKRFVEQFPQWKRQARDWERFAFGEGEEAKLREAMRNRLRDRGQHCCEYAEGMRHQMAVSGALLAGQPKEVMDRFLYDIIKEVVTHEVGHTLGLRHNFKASSIYTLEEIKKRRTTGEATCGSVMDYNPALLFKDSAIEGHFVTPVIGPYDYWAIEYGYRPFDSSYKSPGQEDEAESEDEGKEKKAEETKPSEGPAPAMPAEVKEALAQMPAEMRAQIEKMMKSKGAAIAMAGAAESGGDDGPAFRAPPSGEEGMLKEIASRAAEPELAYATDEDTYFIAPDPRTNRFDMGADPIDWAQSRIDLVDARMKTLLEWGAKEGESWYHVRSAFVRLLVEKVFVLDYVGRYIGGQYFHRSHRGDPDAPVPFVLVEPELQRQALGFIERHLFSDEFFTFPPELLNHLAPARWWHDGTSIDLRMDFPIHRYIGLFQWWNLIDRLYPNTLRRIHDAEMKSDAAGRLTAAEYIQRIQKSCWAGTCDVDKAKKGTWNDTNPFVSDIRRSLQREYLGLMEPLVRTRPNTVLSPDLHAMVEDSLWQLKGQLEEFVKLTEQTCEEKVDSKGVRKKVCKPAVLKLDFASKAHLSCTVRRIERMLSAKIGEMSVSFGGG
ncbi:MAG: DUF5117 domain-containing protein [bacterium]|nr:DUF5117 domain-containing protein [bacterium]